MDRREGVKGSWSRGRRGRGKFREPERDSSGVGLPGLGWAGLGWAGPGRARAGSGPGQGGRRVVSGRSLGVLGG